MTEIEFDTPKAHKFYKDTDPRFLIEIRTVREPTKGENYDLNFVWEVALFYDGEVTLFYVDHLLAEELEDVLKAICIGWQSK